MYILDNVALREKILLVFLLTELEVKNFAHIAKETGSDDNRCFKLRLFLVVVSEDKLAIVKVLV